MTGTPAETFGDKARLERVIGNFLDNAYSHGRGRGVQIEVTADESWCVVTVRDRGPGIPRQDLPFVFERFYKSDASRSREQGGVGLGLAIALENARLLGGTIDVLSDPREGTSFTVRLPRRWAPPEADA